MKPETAQWVKAAEEDLATAEAALERALYAPAIFHCQQSLEKLLKGLWIEKAEEGVPPRRHNLVTLSKEVGLVLSNEQRAFLAELSRQYTPTRYPDVSLDYSASDAARYYQRSCEVFAWLRQRLS